MLALVGVERDSNPNPLGPGLVALVALFLIGGLILAVVLIARSSKARRDEQWEGRRS
jgi:uncharacterized integral membrane protein